jgi:beta-glucosidase
MAQKLYENPIAPTTKTPAESKPKSQNGEADVAPLSLTLDDYIHAAVNKLSLEEKVGQMSQIDLGVIAVGSPCGLQQPQTLDQEKLRIAIEKYHIGSILNVGCGSGTIAPDRWQEIHKGISKASAQYSSTGIPILFGIDAIHGVNYTVGATMFPQQIGQAATWNPDLVVRGAEITALECRLSGIPWNFSPVLDLGRQPLWSRFFETYGEDVYLAKTMTRACIQGYQGKHPELGIDDRHVAACMKHFLGYSYPLSGKDRTPAWIPERELREYYLPTFQTAIEEGALTVMINSGELNGTPVHMNPDILTKLLREELGFKGLAVTDWEDIYKLHTTHKVAASLREAVKLAINAGIDMSMTPNDFQFNELLIDLVQSGEVPMSRINEAVTRILYVKHQLGIYDVVNPSIGKIREALLPSNLGSPEHRKAALATAEESITLLKNITNSEGAPTLPLQKNQPQFVFGRAADDLNLLNGAWTNTWQGNDSQYRHHPLYPTIWEALVNSRINGTIITSNNINQPAQNQNLVVVGGGESSMHLLSGQSRTTKQLKTLKKSLTPNAVAIFCVGEAPGTEIPGNIDDLTAEIGAGDKQLFEFFKANNIPVVMVLATGRPRIITDYANQSSAVLQTYLPGNEGGTAISNILWGKTNPSGKLPYTYPRFAGDVVHYDHKSTERNDKLFGTNAYQPLFDFGDGLSYTEFGYTNLLVSDLGSQGFQVSTTITNKGNRAGKEVCQLYYRDEYASITPSAKKLCAYHKTKVLQPGESETVTFTLNREDFSFINKNLQRVTEPGDITLMLKDQRTTIQMK